MLARSLGNGRTYDAALSNHGLEALGRQRLLEQADQVDLEGVENDVASHEQLVRLAETEQLEGPHELLVLLRSFAHCERPGAKPTWWEFRSEVLGVYMYVCSAGVVVVVVVRGETGWVVLQW